MSEFSYSWAANQTKVDKAVRELRLAGKPIDEEAVKALYVKNGGLVIDEPVVETQEAKEEVVQEAPRRGRRK